MKKSNGLDDIKKNNDNDMDANKRIDNKGFTLVEVLAVLVILVVIMSIAIPNISSSLERSKGKQNNARAQMLYSYAELYISDNKSSITNNEECYITKQELIDGGYASQDEFKDADNNSVGEYIKYTKSTGEFSIIEDIGNLSACSSMSSNTGQSGSNSNNGQSGSNSNVGQVNTFKLGDYISLTPDKTSYTIEDDIRGSFAGESGKLQTINPQNLNLWRVIYIKSDGTIDMVSEYVTPESIWFREAKGYANYIGALQKIAAQYHKSGYTIDARAMGYNGQTHYITDESGFNGSSNTAPGTSSTGTPTSGSGQEYGGGVLGDTLYLNDYQLVGNVYKSDTSKYGITGLKGYRSDGSNKIYLLASRIFYYNGPSEYLFNARCIDTDGSLCDINYFRYRSQSGWYFGSANGPVRIILTLKSGISIKSGNGVKDNPYELN